MPASSRHVPLPSLGGQGAAPALYKSSGQRLNQHHSSDNAGSLTCWATRELLILEFGELWSLKKGSLYWCSTISITFIIIIIFSFRAAPTACRSCQIRVERELQLPAYSTATAKWDLSCICDLHHSSWQCWIPDPLREAGEQTCVLMDTSQACYRWATKGTSKG